jgi:hypothetical protein
MNGKGETSTEPKQVDVVGAADRSETDKIVDALGINDVLGSPAIATSPGT